MNRTFGAIALIAVTAGVALLAKPPQEGAASAVPAPEAARGEDRAPAATALQRESLAERLQARVLAEPRANPMQAQAAQQPRRAEATPVAAVRIEAPAKPRFPYRFGGYVRVAGEAASLVLLDGGRAHVVKRGQVLEPFRIEAFDAQALRVTYLPSGEVLSLSYAELLPEGQPLSPGGPSPFPRTAADESEARVPGPLADNREAEQRPAPAAMRRRDPAPEATPPSAPGQAKSGGAMVMAPPAAGTGMVMTPPAPGTGMSMKPGAAGRGMVMTPPGAGSAAPQAPPQR
jgi:hypothetical protein